VCLAYAALWFIIPKDPDSTIARFDQASGWYLLQGLIWPVAGAAGPWRAWLPSLSNPAWAPLIIAAPSLWTFPLPIGADDACLCSPSAIWFAWGAAHLGHARLRLRGHLPRNLRGGGRRGLDLGRAAHSIIAQAEESLVEIAVLGAVAVVLVQT
jgi:hypothetical protein